MPRTEARGVGGSLSLYIDITRQEIVNESLQIQSFIQDINECDGPQEILDDLSSEVRSKIAALRKHFEQLETMAKEQDQEKDRLQLQDELKSHRQMLISTLAAFRNAVVACQQKIDRSNKQQLFEEDKETVIKRRRYKDKQNLTAESAGITDHLLSISRHLAETTQRSSDTLDTLVNSSSTLHGTQEEFKSMGGVINQSGKLLSKYGRRELTDKVLVFFAFAFFMACVLYIMKKRLF